jgi:Tfp pilus assembly protein FimV
MPTLKGLFMRSLSVAVFVVQSVAVVGLLTADAAQAQPMPDTAQALRTLMGPSKAPGTGMAPEAAAMPQGHMVLTKRGDTLAKILAANMGPHPYNPKAVHQAVAAMNPQAFIRGNPNRLIAGVMLRLPSPTELHAVLTGQMMPTTVGARDAMGAMGHMGAASAQAGPMHAVPNLPNNAPTGAEDFERHRGWPRFPR